MTNFALHTVLLLLIAFFLGCVVGCVLRAMFGRDEAAAAGAGAQAEAPPVSTVEAATDAISDASAEPATEAEAAAEPVDVAAADNLKLIKGIGKAIERRLHAMGVTRFEQIAGWTRDDVERVDEQLSFRGRIDREEWIAQAEKLARRD